ncbi:MAG: hypothetical protein RIE77_02595 [Phycisphaerales bacterium]|jgi:hypothetical protein
MKRTGSTTSIVIATIAGLSVLGVAGYRMMSGDCGACAVTGNEVTTAAVATESDCGSCCALMEGAETEATLVSTGESCESACSGEKAASCDSAKNCDTACSGEAAEVEMISTEATADCADACGDACAGDACGTDADACCGKCEAGKELAKAPQ